LRHCGLVLQAGADQFGGEAGRVHDVAKRIGRLPLRSAAVGASAVGILLMLVAGDARHCSDVPHAGRNHLLRKPIRIGVSDRYEMG
jgi:hypothetical protein